MRVLVVDDEPLARAALAALLSQRSDVEEFRVADDAQQALATLRDRSFDVLLLDIHMPGLSGLGLLESLSEQGQPSPAVVFITAYPEHAVAAFERQAVDYVLKPFVPKRVHEALDVAKRRSTQERAARLLDVLGSIKLQSERVDRIAIKDKGRIILIDATELISAEAHGNYVLLQKKTGSYLLRETMAGIAEKLKPYGFIRIHRSVLVNRAFVNTIQCGSAGNYILQTSLGKEYHVSRTYRDNLRGLAQFWMVPTASASTEFSRAAALLSESTALAELRSFDKAQDKNKHYRADRCHNDGAEQATARGETQCTEQKPTKQCAEYPNNDIPNDAEATTLHEQPREPSCHQPYECEPHELHVIPLLSQHPFDVTECQRSREYSDNARAAIRQRAHIGSSGVHLLVLHANDSEDVSRHVRRQRCLHESVACSVAAQRDGCAAQSRSRCECGRACSGQVPGACIVRKYRPVGHGRPTCRSLKGWEGSI